VRYWIAFRECMPDAAAATGSRPEPVMRLLHVDSNPVSVRAFLALVAGSTH
jgi:hypothetical protein